MLSCAARAARAISTWFLFQLFQDPHVLAFIVHFPCHDRQLGVESTFGFTRSKNCARCFLFLLSVDSFSVESAHCVRSREWDQIEWNGREKNNKWPLKFRHKANGWMKKEKKKKTEIWQEYYSSDHKLSKILAIVSDRVIAFHRHFDPKKRHFLRSNIACWALPFALVFAFVAH